MTEFLEKLVLEYPWLAGFIFAVGTFRIFFKPVMSALEAAIAETPTKVDDEWLAKLKSSKVYTMLVWLVDYLASVKLPGAFKKQ